MTDETKLSRRIAEALDEAAIIYDRDVTVGGLRPDFVVHGPEGEVVVVESKAWDPRGGNTARALEQVQHYKNVTNADGAFVVMDDLARNRRADGVVDVANLVEALDALFGTIRAGRKKHKPLIADPVKLVFAAMPFSRSYDDTYFVAMTAAAEAVGAECQRVDRTEFVGDVVEEVKRLISASDAVIVDLSEAKPNVLYEAGYAHALGKPCVHITSTDADGLPFNVRNWNTIKYNPGQTARLRSPLTKRLKSVLGIKLP